MRYISIDCSITAEISMAKLRSHCDIISVIRKPTDKV